MAWEIQAMHTEMSSENLNRKDHSRGEEVDGTMIFKWLLKKCETVEWIHPARNILQCSVLVNTAHNVPVP
jgi:hypothetical protein